MSDLPYSTTDLLAYSTDTALTDFQQDIMSLGVDNWGPLHEEARGIIDNDLHEKWFVPAKIEIGYKDQFNASLLLSNFELKRASVYKVLELAYLFMVHSSTDDHFITKMNLFKVRYEEEIDQQISIGIKYDWNSDGGISSQPISVNQQRFRTIRR